MCWHSQLINYLTLDVVLRASTSTSASRLYLSSDQIIRRIELHHFPSSTHIPPFSHVTNVTGPWVSKAPSLIVISIFVFPSLPAINGFVCGLGVRHVYEYL